MILIISGFKGKPSCCTEIFYRESEDTGKISKKRLKKPNLENSGPILMNDHATLGESRRNMKDIEESPLYVTAVNGFEHKSTEQEKPGNSRDIILNVITDGEDPVYLEPKEVKRTME